MQTHTQQIVMRCVFQHHSIRTSINFFRNLNYSSLSVGSDHRASLRFQRSLMSHDPVTGSPLFLPSTILIGSDHYSVWDPLTQSSSHHNLALVTVAQMLTLIYPASTHQLWGRNVHFHAYISHPLTGVIITRSVLFTSPVSSCNVVADLCLCIYK